MNLTREDKRGIKGHYFGRKRMIRDSGQIRVISENLNVYQLSNTKSWTPNNTKMSIKIVFIRGR